MTEVDREKLEAAYARLGNVHKAAAECGVSHSVAHRRLTAWGVMKGVNRLSDADRAIIRAYYEHTPAEIFDLAALARRLGRTKPFVARAAGEVGLTKLSRPQSEKTRQAFLEASANKWQHRPHPRGFSGNSHTAAARAVIGERSRQSWEHQKATGSGNMSPENLAKLSARASARMAVLPAEKAYSRAAHGRRPDLGDCYFRSSWEANYARYLNWLTARGEIDSWEYEPEVFWFEKIKRGVRSYKPDFRIREKGAVYFVEIKGWMDPKSKTKLKRMKKYHPGVEVRLVEQKQYKAIERAVARLIPGWETRASAAVLLRGERV